MRSAPRSRTSSEARSAPAAGLLENAVMNNGLLIALISTDYPPLRTSAAVQLRDLAEQFVALGQRPIVIVPSSMSDKPWMIERLDGVEVLRVAAPPTRS